MERRLFGTDGVRGQANWYPMTPDVVLKLAMATACVLRRGNHRNTVIIGKDTRLSGYMLEPALTAGFTAMGMDVLLLGPVPTPAVAMLTHSMRADLGVMISASHNPYEDNGIKLFGADGYKLSDALEAEIEALIESDTLYHNLSSPDALGRARRVDDARGRYMEHVKTYLPRGMRLDGIKIVVDCAHGAAYKTAPQVLWELGAEVVELHTAPNGFNINEASGAVNPNAMREAVVLHNAHLGIALDGDADRLIMADENGKIIDGDQIIGTIAKQWQIQGLLANGGFAATVMSNLGLERFATRLGLTMLRTKVGDRYVVQAMREHGYNLGGEQSGHIIFSDVSTTGDGLAAALQVLSVLVDVQKPASDVCHVFEPVPQQLTNIRMADDSVLNHPAVQAAIEDSHKVLEGKGRLLVRKSGTEPLLRVMVEAEDSALMAQITASLTHILQQQAVNNAA